MSTRDDCRATDLFAGLSVLTTDGRVPPPQIWSIETQHVFWSWECKKNETISKFMNWYEVEPDLVRNEVDRSLNWYNINDDPNFILS